MRFLTQKHIAFILTFLVIIFVGFACDNFTFTKSHKGKVVKVLDGDSFNILQNGKEVRIRLAEIDAPEHGQPYWRKSKQALQEYVAGKQVVIEEFDRDRYGRIVGHVYSDDIWINGKLVQLGFAYVYPRYAVSKKLYEFESEAEKNRRGIWKLPDNERIKPWEWRAHN